ncbi:MULTISPECIES: guanine deaminase [unclassified Colwellia]|uniref:guanine deaminase n=1 Tax=unclassified Colwellia TaxID=196834 RepID=UPI0015F5F4C2|nr:MULTISPECIES: guanine deaminase [unclassified Colwellia]MBA6379180.1 guanine deaminase [Colwellia sp. BRX10-7]MBA6386074.1 guanine deaminase [Colwellia sp. BRX10-2]MBA6401953.1 guanine deaminase [Colwellia sp. BRX10-5]MBA6406498.1 guanine deaminase [Colwellia sp. BRX10-1]
MSVKAFRGEILHFVEDPASTLCQDKEQAEQSSYQYFEDGILLIENGKVKQLGTAKAMLADLEHSLEIQHIENGLIVPGFIDTHIHYPQTEMIGSYGEQLLQWLEDYTFPTEKKFADKAYASKISEFFLNQLLANGTTTALVFGTVHAESVNAFFEVALAKNLRMIAGKVMMDRNAPDYLLDTAQSSYQQSEQLIKDWHGKGRLQYAITPRFAPTSSDEQLSLAGQLLKEHPGVYMQTHLSENLKEIEWVKSLNPDCENYLDVYKKHQLLGSRSVFAHGIHLCDAEYSDLSQSNSALSFCPSSNLFLGSGLFKLDVAQQHNIKVGLGTDIGAGTSFSLLETLKDAYKTQQLRGKKLDSLQSFYLATLGGARALDLEGTVGNFQVGCEADFIVLDYHATPLMKLRLEQCQSLAEKLFSFTILGDDRAVKATYIQGELAEINCD